ncbi:hypothetical protein HYH03_004670 [Edaphochlamys debaryana]|uniref:Uncharacterized protein n=1 Tax=Edaphochlamys debaryana TaxID=47281 RepID=A0A835Y7L1_9CHLO|nr:hypothetical protein HYH03_004670 [Edaphochlamys debaryana]|eukprot:KAG2497521.1 hypothetical protein HYH03_004670 [Edaphochlamys debaryana]
MDDVLKASRAIVEPFLGVASASDLYGAYKSLPYEMLLLGHCIYVGTMFPELKHRFLLHFLVTYLAGFGGGMLTALLITDPDKAHINILAHNQVGVYLTICWWVMAYCPFNLAARLHSFLPVRMFTKACVTVMRANLMIARVDVAVAMYPTVLAAPLILGTLAGCGGKFLSDALRGGMGVLPGTSELAAPGFVWRSAFLGAAGYWAACKATALLTSAEAAAVLITVLLVHSVVSDLLGAAASDFTYPIARVLHTLSLVPMPTAGPVALAPAKPAPAPAPAKKADVPAPRALPAKPTVPVPKPAPAPVARASSPAPAPVAPAPAPKANGVAKANGAAAPAAVAPAAPPKKQAAEAAPDVSAPKAEVTVVKSGGGGGGEWITVGGGKKADPKKGDAKKKGDKAEAKAESKKAR